jgi:peptide/nickel transport system substrate-binding protein
VNPDNPQSTTDWLCDLCEGKVPEATDDGHTYTFKIRKGVEFHDGTPLTSADIKATYDRLAFPAEGVLSNRKASFAMIKAVEAPDSHTVVFRLKYPSGAFLPAIGQPFNFVYAKKDLDKDKHWPEKNINGTGAFRFVQHQPGAFVEGKRYEKYHHKGKPYLDGYKAISAPKMAVRLQAIRGDRASIEFRGFPPKARDDLIEALGSKITVQSGTWNCGNVIAMNSKQKPFDDVRVRRALTLAVDRWSAEKSLGQIALAAVTGGIVMPGHPLAATKEELTKLAGYGDIEASRKEARRLLKEAGAENLTFDLHNRSVDQPYRIVGTWLIGEWKKIGVKVTQKAVSTGPWYDKFRKPDYQVGVSAVCRAVVNPLLDVATYVSHSLSPSNYGHYEDEQINQMYDAMNRTGDLAEQRQIMRAFEKRVLDDQAYWGHAQWWQKINPHRSYVKGWKIAPSHYLNQHLDQVWLDKG